MQNIIQEKDTKLGKSKLENIKMLNSSLLVLCFLFTISNVFGGYIPPYYEGKPIVMGVASLDPPNFTGNPVYRIDFRLEKDGENGKVYPEGFIHR